MKEDSKSVVRRSILRQLRNQKEEERLKKGKIIQDKLFAAVEFQNAHIILFYASFDGEVDTFDTMKQTQRLGKKIALPMIIKDQKKIVPSLVEDLEKELTSGSYGIREPKKEYLRPVELENVDLVIVPGVAFDKNNNRLGRGGGYYDRFLMSFPSRTPKIGLAFDFQILDNLPSSEEHDVAVSRVLVN